LLEINQVQHFYLLPCIRGDAPRTHWHEVSSRNSGDTKLSYGENPKSLSHLVLDRYRVMTDEKTDRKTDRITVANTHYS